MPNDLTAAHLFSATGIPYSIVNGFPKVTADINGQKGLTLKVRIKASDVQPLIEELFPPPADNGDIRTLAPTAANFGNTDLYPVSAEFEVEDGSLPGDPYGIDAVAASSYDPIYIGTIQYALHPIYDHAQSIAIEMLMIPPAGVTYVPSSTGLSSSGDAEQLNPTPPENPTLPITKLIPVAEHTLTFPRVAKPNFTTITLMLGRINNALLTTLNDAPAETAMFLGCQAKKSVRYRGGPSSDPWSLELKFAVKIIHDGGKVYSWNDYWNPRKAGGPGWMKVKRADDRYIYQTGSFALLFNQG